MLRARLEQVANRTLVRRQNFLTQKIAADDFRNQNIGAAARIRFGIELVGMLGDHADPIRVAVVRHDLGGFLRDCGYDFAS